MADVCYDWSGPSCSGRVIAPTGVSMEQRSTIIEVDGSQWLIDPFDDISDHVSSPVAGIIVTTTHHWRDAIELADRYDVTIEVPSWFRSIPAHAERVSTPTVDGFSFIEIADTWLWQEAALWNGSSLIVGDALTTSSVMGQHPLNLYPYLFLHPPEVLAEITPDRLICGHGDPVDSRVDDAIEQALTVSPWMMPFSIISFLYRSTFSDL